MRKEEKEIWIRMNGNSQWWKLHWLFLCDLEHKYILRKEKKSYVRKDKRNLYRTGKRQRRR